MYREERIVARCEVEFERLGRRIEALSEDLSPRGVFVATDELLEVDARVSLTIRLADGIRLRVTGRVAHLLLPAAAVALGRRVGMGFEFLDLGDDGRARLTAHIEQVKREVASRLEPLSQSFAVIADPGRELLERLQTALGAVGFETLPFATGTEALAACHELIPDIVVAALEMPALDGLTLLARLREKAALVNVPVVLMTEAASHYTRLQAFRMGVRDIIYKPFTDEELCIRVRRAALEGRRPPAEPVLRGSLGEISAATLLSLFEFERKSGILHIKHDGETARLFLAGGRVVKVEGPARRGDPAARIMIVLDWRSGRFEFSPCEVVAGDELGLATTQLLLEHARIRDEEAQGEA